MRRMLVGWAVCVAACGTPDGTDIMRLAVDGVPGALLSVWGDPSDAHHAFIAGGYVGVDHAMLSDGVVGRLVEYRTGAFTTRCTTDEVLWWTSGTTDGAGAQVVYAVGENARVVRFAGGSCTVLTVDATWTQGTPTFWGVHAVSDTDVWMVGGSPLPTGPRGVLVHYDGTHFTQDPALPSFAQQQNLFKIDAQPDGTLVVVGTGALVMTRGPNDAAWTVASMNARTGDNTLFTVSCARDTSGACYAVGGLGSGFIMSAQNAWAPLAMLGGMPLDDLPGLNGVFVQDATHVFAVGIDGFTMFTDGQRRYQPPMSRTTNTLHGVGGTSAVVIAVGGQLDTSTAQQRGVILVRGDDSNAFTFDGQSFAPVGTTKQTL